MLITFCGVRGSTPATGARFARYGGDTSCVAVSHSAGSPPVLLLDAGTGLANATGLLFASAPKCQPVSATAKIGSGFS